MPAAIFKNHVLAFVNGEYYDPSYGKKYTDWMNINDDIEGFYIVDPTQMLNGVKTNAMMFRKNVGGFSLEKHIDSY